MQRDFIKEFLTYIQVEKGLARHTLEGYKRDLDRLQAWATSNSKQLSELTRADLRKWIASLSREGLARTISRAVSATRGFFKFLMLDGHIKSHPAEDLDTPQRFSYLPKFLTEERSIGYLPRRIFQRRREYAIVRCSKSCTQRGCAFRSWLI